MKNKILRLLLNEEIFLIFLFLLFFTLISIILVQDEKTIEKQGKEIKQLTIEVNMLKSRLGERK